MQRLLVRSVCLVLAVVSSAAASAHTERFTAPPCEPSTALDGIDLDALRAAPLTRDDLKAFRRIENAHGQIQEWTAMLAARLRAGERPRQPDPALDGRAAGQIARMQEIYAGTAATPIVTRAFGALADADRARLRALSEMTTSVFDPTRYHCLDAAVSRIWEAILTWRKKIP
jgi:hypothetical protein